MFKFKFKALAFAALAIGLLLSSRSALAQISVTFGAEPVCPYGYFDYAPTTALPTVTTDPIG